MKSISVMSYMETRKRIEPWTDPCGTTRRTLQESDSSQSMKTYSYLKKRRHSHEEILQNR